MKNPTYVAVESEDDGELAWLVGPFTDDEAEAFRTRLVDEFDKDPEFVFTTGICSPEEYLSANEEEGS